MCTLISKYFIILRELNNQPQKKTRITYKNVDSDYLCEMDLQVTCVISALSEFLQLPLIYEKKVIRKIVQKI